MVKQGQSWEIWEVLVIQPQTVLVGWSPGGLELPASGAKVRRSQPAWTRAQEVSSRSDGQHHDLRASPQPSQKGSVTLVLSKKMFHSDWKPPVHVADFKVHKDASF